MYSVLVEPLAVQDIQHAVDYYEEQQPGLGKKFESVLDEHFISLGKNPFFQIRYENVHCLPVKKYPYMIHFTIGKQRQNCNYSSGASYFTKSRNLVGSRITTLP